MPGERVRLNALAALVETVECRRAQLLRHFGEEPAARCGNCDNCLDPAAQVDATVLAQKLLSAVYRTGQSYGAGHIEAVLTGRSDERIVGRGHDKLSVFGIVAGDEARLIKPLVRTLVAREALETTEHGGLMLGPGARAMMKGEAPVLIAEPPVKRTQARSARRGRGGRRQPDRRSAVRRAARHAARARRRSQCAALCDLSRRGAARDGDRKARDAGRDGDNSRRWRQKAGGVGRCVSGGDPALLGGARSSAAFTLVSHERASYTSRP